VTPSSAKPQVARRAIFDQWRRNDPLSVAASDTRSGRTHRVSMPYHRADHVDGRRQQAARCGTHGLRHPDCDAHCPRREHHGPCCHRSPLSARAASGHTGGASSPCRDRRTHNARDSSCSMPTEPQDRGHHLRQHLRRGASGQRLAVQMRRGILVFDAPSARVVATIPVRAPYGHNVDWIRWDQSERSIVISATPGLGHD
jgi:hypothetical protein